MVLQCSKWSEIKSHMGSIQVSPWKKIYPRVFKQLVEGSKIKKWDGKEEKEENNCQGPKLASYNGPNQPQLGPPTASIGQGKLYKLDLGRYFQSLLDLC